MGETPILITVFGNSANEVCLISGCGAQVTSAEMADELAEAFGRMFGDRVRVRHVDVGDPAVRPGAAAIVDGARRRNLPYPLVAIDGQVVLAGKADVDSVLRKLDEVLASSEASAKGER